FCFSSRRRHTRFSRDWSSDVCSSDLRATHIARDMVMRYGMSDALGPMVYAENEGEVFLGRSVTKTTNISEQTMQKVDGEVRRIKIGRASCREGVQIATVAVSVKGRHT